MLGPPTRNHSKINRYGIRFGGNFSAVRSFAPIQDISGFFTANICRDHYVLSIIASTIDAVLHTKSVVRKDIRLKAVNAKQNAVSCFMTVTTKGFMETVSYAIVAEDNSFSIILGGKKASKLVPEEMATRPSTLVADNTCWNN